MLIRLAIFVGIIYAGYRILRSVLFRALTEGRDGPAGRSGELADEMIKDPYCQVYFPRRDGVPLQVGGQELMFCSTECRDRYLALQSGESKRRR